MTSQRVAELAVKGPASRLQESSLVWCRVECCLSPAVPFTYVVTRQIQSVPHLRPGPGRTSAHHWSPAVNVQFVCAGPSTAVQPGLSVQDSSQRGLTSTNAARGSPGVPTRFRRFGAQSTIRTRIKPRIANKHMMCSLRSLTAPCFAHSVLAVMSVVHVAADSGSLRCPTPRREVSLSAHKPRRLLNM